MAGGIVKGICIDGNGIASLVHKINRLSSRIAESTTAERIIINLKLQRPIRNQRVIIGGIIRITSIQNNSKLSRGQD